MALDVREESIPFHRVVLGPGLQHLDRDGDSGERRAQLVRGVADELAQHAVVAQLVGDVLDQQEGRVPVVGGDARDPK